MTLSTRLSFVAEESSVSTQSEAARRLYIGNVLRTVNNSKLQFVSISSARLLLGFYLH